MKIRIFNSGKFFARAQCKKFPAQKSAFVSIFAIFFSAIVVSVLTAIYILLVRQIEIMNIDYASFQALYSADSAFECAVYKEQTATDTKSVFLPVNAGTIGNCGTASDLAWLNQPVITTGRAKSILRFSLTTDQGEFCTFINTDKETRDFSQSTTAPQPNFMSISGQNRGCADSPAKVVERLVEFFF